MINGKWGKVVRVRLVVWQGGVVVHKISVSVPNAVPNILSYPHSTPQAQCSLTACLHCFHVPFHNHSMFQECQMSSRETGLNILSSNRLKINRLISDSVPTGLQLANALYWNVPKLGAMACQPCNTLHPFIETSSELQDSRYNNPLRLSCVCTSTFLWHVAR